MRVLAPLDAEGRAVSYEDYTAIYNDDIEEVFVYWGRLAVNGAYLKDQLKR